MVEVIVKSPKEVVRKIAIPVNLYRAIRSFVESSFESSYPWRIGYEFSNHYVWSKDGKWKLMVYKTHETPS